jgi:hypothetical protein
MWSPFVPSHPSQRCDEQYSHDSVASHAHDSQSPEQVANPQSSQVPSFFMCSILERTDVEVKKKNAPTWSLTAAPSWSIMPAMAHENPVLAFRRAKGWTRRQFVEELFARTGVSISTTMLGHVERGYRYFGGKVAVAVERAFKIKVSEQRAVELSHDGRAA